MSGTTQWERIRASLGAYEPAALAALLREALATLRPPRHPPRYSQHELKPAMNAVKEVLRTHLGTWYTGSGLQLGNESLGGYCWCHSFFNQNPTLDLDVESNLQRLLAALGRIHGYLRSLDGLFASVGGQLTAARGDPALQAEALREGLVRTVDLTAEATSCEEAWYGIALDALEWCCEAQGLRMEDALGERLTDLFQFTSWVVAPPEVLQEGARQVAEELLGGTS
jgi:hypothetical protein